MNKTLTQYTKKQHTYHIAVSSHLQDPDLFYSNNTTDQIEERKESVF